MIPGWVVTVRLSGSISRTRSIRVNAIVSAPSMPAAAPESPVPGAARDDRDVELAAQPHEPGDLVGRVAGARPRAAGRPAR